MPIRTIALLLIMLVTTGVACRDQRTNNSHTSANGTAPPAVQADGAAASPDAPAGGAIKQVIVLYSGDTRSIPLANDDYTPPEGGLSGLANAITEYEGQILRFNQLRVENAGGDAAAVRADFDSGMLGDNPYLLLDYGYWERPNDPQGAMLVKLYLEMFSQLHYTAVGAALYAKLDPEKWRAYAAVAPQGFTLLNSAGSAREGTIACKAIVTRELFGSKWGIVAIPVPEISFTTPAELEQAALQVMVSYANDAADKLKQAGCANAILLATGGPASFYDKLKSDQRFTVVLGAPPSQSAEVGYGEFPVSGPLLLPALAGGGRELGACHLIFSAGGNRLVQYNLVRTRCSDDGRQPYPYRAQVKEASAAHEQAVHDHQDKTG